MRRAATIALLLTLAGLQLVGCSGPRRDGPRPLKAREILKLVSRGDELPLPRATAAQVQDVGQFAERPVVKGPPEAAPLCPARRYELVSHSRLVAAELLRGFGFTFVLEGEPQRQGQDMGGRAVPLTLQVEHPPLQDPVTGEVVSVQTQHIMGCIGYPSDAVFQFTSDWERVSGPWTLRLLAEGRELASKRFDVEGGRTPPPLTAQQPLAREAGAADLKVRLKGSAAAAVAPPMQAKPALRPRAAQAQGQRRIYVLVSSNIYKANAEQDVAMLQSLGYPARLGIYHDPAKGRTWHTARLGSYPSLRAAEQAAREFTRKEGRQAYVVVRREAAAQRTGDAAGAFTVQVAACLEPGNATADIARLQAAGWPATLLQRRGDDGRLWHTVVLGSYPSRQEAERAAREFRKKEGRQAFVLAVP